MSSTHQTHAANDNGGDTVDQAALPMERLYPLVQMLAKRTAHRLLVAANDNTANDSAALAAAPLPTDSITR